MADHQIKINPTQDNDVREIIPSGIKPLEPVNQDIEAIIECSDNNMEVIMQESSIVPSGIKPLEAVKQGIDATRECSDNNMEVRMQENSIEPFPLQSPTDTTKIIRDNYQCHICDYSTPNMTHYKKHLRTHTEWKIYKCSNCNKSFARRTALVLPGMNPHCTQCEKELHKKCALVQPKIVHKKHTREKTFRCSHCDKCFAKRSYLVQHHTWCTGEKPLHQKLHTDVKPYQCNHCKKYFSRKDALVRHMKMHPGEKQFQCSHCDKCFAQQSDLVQHQIMHTEEKPFQCRSFKINQSLFKRTVKGKAITK